MYPGPNIIDHKMTADINRTICAKKATFSWYSSDSSEIKSRLKYTVSSSKGRGLALTSKAGREFTRSLISA